MAIISVPQKQGGTIHKERVKYVNLNSTGSSTAIHAGQPNESGWLHEGEEYKGEPARQCGAVDNTKRYCNICDTIFSNHKNDCPECGSDDYRLLRCQWQAEPTKATCRRHGGAMVKTKDQSDLARRGSMTNGISMVEIMLCPCMHSEDCEYANKLVNPERYGSSVPRCWPEQEFYDSMTAHFQKTYKLDPAADQIMLNRLVMSMLRIMRGEKIIAKYGEIVERVRTSPDGSYETWFEQSAAAKTVDALDRRLQSWLKELAISKAAREGKTLNVKGQIDLTTVLSDPPKTKDEVIDIDYEEVG